MGNLPTGTVTFLFTDIEGSTKLAQEYPDKWEDLRARHHEILRSAIDTNNGHVFHIIGDAFCAAFHTALDALKASVDAQRNLLQENWAPTSLKVRMGLNTGTAYVSTDMDPSEGYKGYTTMARVQRLMSAAHGGQIVVSLATEELIRDGLPGDVYLRDLGEQRLKDLIRPERIYQAVAKNLPSEFPPLKTLDAYRQNLPVQMTSFIGREKDMSEIAQAISEHRLVTLTGAGGTGKTRLSLQVGADMLDQFRDGVWFVELASLTDSNLLPGAILSAFGIREEENRKPEQYMLDYLREKNLLLILDNCEHLIEACAQLVDTLLHHIPTSKVLTTSREPLGVQGELTWQVSPLSVPDLKNLPAFGNLSQFEAVQLFIERANLVQPHFKLTGDNAQAIAQICQQLDGNPLAIELAAARVKIMSVDQISTRLNDRFQLLTGGARTAFPRQQTLRATIDWSYNLLLPTEQELLQRLSVFVGGFTLEAVELVRPEKESDLETFELVTSLVDKSLINMYEAAGEARYRMFETTRQYALGKLREAGGEESATNNHLGYFLQLAEKAQPQLIGPDQTEWLNRLEREHDNFRSALRWCMESGKGEDAARMAGALGMFWFKHCHYSEGRRFYADILERDWNISDRAQLKAWESAGDLAQWQQDVGEARRIFTENMERAQKLGDQSSIAYHLHKFGTIAYLEGNFEQGIALNKKSIALSREVDAIWVMAMAQISLGYQEHIFGNLSQAEELYQESLRHCRLLGEKWGIALILGNLGMIFYSKGDLPAAKRTFLEGLDLMHELGNIDGTISTLTGIVSVFQEEGEQISSTRLQGIIVAKEMELAISLQGVERDMFDSATAALKESMGEEAYNTQFEYGMTLSLDDALKIVSGQN